MTSVCLQVRARPVFPCTRSSVARPNSKPMPSQTQDSFPTRSIAQAATLQIGTQTCPKSLLFKLATVQEKSQARLCSFLFVKCFGKRTESSLVSTGISPLGTSLRSPQSFTILPWETSKHCFLLRSPEKESVKLSTQLKTNWQQTLQLSKDGQAALRLASAVASEAL